MYGENRQFTNRLWCLVEMEALLTDSQIFLEYGKDSYFSSLRPRYQTALLSNSFVGARKREQEHYHFAEMTDLIIYSHEVGIAKPERRIFELTCERIGVQPEDVIFLDDSAYFPQWLLAAIDREWRGDYNERGSQMRERSD